MQDGPQRFGCWLVVNTIARFLMCLSDVEEDVCGVVAVGEVADLVDHQDVRLEVARERVTQLALATGTRKVVDELGAVDEEAIEPFCRARYAIAMARCVFPRPGLPSRITELPSRTKSGESSEPNVVRRRVD